MHRLSHTDEQETLLGQKEDCEEALLDGGVAKRKWWREYVAEGFGSFVLVFFGTGAVAGSIFTGDLVGLWQVAVVWGLGIALAIYSTHSFSEAHLNPAISVTMAFYGHYTNFSWEKCRSYVCAQLLGSIMAGMANYFFWEPFINRYESDNNITRGEANSQMSAMMFGEYFPNPNMFPPTNPENDSLVTPARAFMVEATGTAILAYMIFALTDGKNKGISKGSAPLLIAFTVSSIIAIFAPMTQAGLNPARDFGPRIVAAFAGWWDVAIPGPKNGFWVYILGPFIGAPIGAGIYLFCVRGHDFE